MRTLEVCLRKASLRVEITDVKTLFRNCTINRDFPVNWEIKAFKKLEGFTWEFKQLILKFPFNIYLNEYSIGFAVRKVDAYKTVCSST